MLGDEHDREPDEAEAAKPARSGKTSVELRPTRGRARPEPVVTAPTNDEAVPAIRPIGSMAMALKFGMISPKQTA